jgi:hypothetical protein
LEKRFYDRLRVQRGDGSDLIKVVVDTVSELTTRDTNESRPGMLLGKIQSGKTRAFLGIIAEAFDHGFDVAIVLTKGTRTLSQQTVRRIQTDFQLFRSGEELEVYDIMQVPALSAWEIDEQKLIFVAKKEANNMKRLLKLFQDVHPSLLSKRVLIIDDEADFASIRFTKKKGEADVEQGRIANRIDELRRELLGSAFLQVTATPYSLYLQPEDYPVQPGGNFTFEPKRPAFTKLVPIHGGYVGGDHYFGEHTEAEPEYYLWHPVEDDELLALRKEDRRRIRKDQVLTQDKIAGIRHALVTFVTAVAIRRHQQRSVAEQQKRYAMIVHVETSRTAHAWQSTVVSELIDALQEAIKSKDPIFLSLVDAAIQDLSRSVIAEGMLLPTRDIIASEVLDYFKKGAVATEKVNSDNDVQKLLDDNAELKLRTPCNIFIGGQILDRGITVPNLISFYYGRSPKRMQQDTALQHARMYGARARADLAVTRFYTTAHNYLSLQSIHKFDSALRHAFESGAHDRGVAFVVKDHSNRVIPCAPNKILVSSIVALRPGSAYLPVGFQTKSRTTMSPIMLKLDRLIPSAKLEDGSIAEITTETAIEIINLAERCFEFEAGYRFDWEACRAAIEYFSKIAPPPEEKGKCLIAGGVGRRLSWQRAGGRFSDAPHTMQDRATVRRIIGHKPILVLSRQDGREEDKWRGTPFWWPVLFAPAKAAPSVFASSLRDGLVDEEVFED